MSSKYVRPYLRCPFLGRGCGGGRADIYRFGDGVLRGKTLGLELSGRRAPRRELYEPAKPQETGRRLRGVLRIMR